MTHSVMFDPDVIDGAARAWMTTVARSMAEDPGMRVRQGGNAWSVWSGLPLDVANGVFSYARKADPADLARSAADLAAIAGGDPQTPWCFLLRSDPTPEVLDLATGHGLTETSTESFMALELNGAGLPAPSPSSLRIGVARDDDYDSFVTTMGGNFGIPAGLTARLFSRAYVSTQETSVYLGWVDGIPAVTGMGLLLDGFIGLSAISTRPEYRKRGYGRLMAEHVIRQGREAGAHTAYLRPSEMALSLYTTMGFRTAEQWTTLTAG